MFSPFPGCISGGFNLWNNHLSKLLSTLCYPTSTAWLEQQHSFRQPIISPVTSCLSVCYSDCVPTCWGSRAVQQTHLVLQHSAVFTWTFERWILLLFVTSYRWIKDKGSTVESHVSNLKRNVPQWAASRFCGEVPLSCMSFVNCVLLFWVCVCMCNLVKTPLPKCRTFKLVRLVVTAGLLPIRISIW